MSVVSKPTVENLRLFCVFFGIDLENNAHLFRYAADNGGDAFAKTMDHIATAIKTDARYRINERIRKSIREEKEKRPC